MKEKEFNIALALISGYLFIQIMADLTVGKFIALTPILFLPVGSLLYAVSFTWIDLINDYLGKPRARKLVVAGVMLNVLMVMWFQFYIRVPGAPWWAADPFPQQAIEYVLGGIWRIYVASIASEFITENMDITIFHAIRSRWPTLPRWPRALLSNTVSAPLDGFCFSTFAFLGTLSLEDLASATLGAMAYKAVIGYVSIPLIYLVKARHTPKVRPAG